MFGEKIVDAGTQISTLVTNGTGSAVTNLQLPLMSERYVGEKENADKQEPEGVDKSEGDVAKDNTGNDSENTNTSSKDTSEATSSDGNNKNADNNDKSSEKADKDSGCI